MQQDNAGKYIVTAVRCEDCGAGLSEFRWSPGTKCPNCASVNFVPVPVVEKASAYSEADRSQGFALEDVRLGRLAIWAGFLTSKQMQRALHIQSGVARTSASVPDLGALLVREKLLTRRQVQALLDARSVGPGDRSDNEFAQAALQQGYVTASQLANCRAMQAEAIKSRGEALPLPLLLHEKRYMKENVILTLLTALQRKEMGLLYEIQAVIQGCRSGGIAGLLGSSDSPLRQPRTIVAIVLLLVMIFYWVHRLSGEREFAHVECVNCHALSGAPLDSVWPLMCSECSEKAVYPVGMCLECGAKFPVKSFEYGTKCPNCGASGFAIVTNKNVERLESEIAARLDAEKLE